MLTTVIVLGGLFLFSLGRFTGLKEGAVTTVAVTASFREMLATVVGHAKTQSELLIKALGLKDEIITSLAKENKDLKEALEDDAFCEVVTDDDEDEDDVEEDDKVAVGVSNLPSRREVRDNPLQEQIRATYAILDDVKDEMPTATYILLKSMLLIKDKKDAN
jgi:hypothetical protein